MTQTTIDKVTEGISKLVGLRGAGHGPAVIPLESTPPRGYRLISAAAGSARDLAPASPDPEEAYSPPAEEDIPWPGGRFLGHDPMVNRVSPLATPQLPSLPTESGEGAVGLAPAYVETYPLALPGSLVGEAGPPAVPPLFDEGRNTVAERLSKRTTTSECNFYLDYSEVVAESSWHFFHWFLRLTTLIIHHLFTLSFQA